MLADPDRPTSFAASSSSESIPPLLREARMVLELRRASLQFGAPRSSAAGDGNKAPDGMEQSRAKYQEALKLLQDPLLPVRAQGLHLLKSLIKPATKNDTTATTATTSQDLLRTDPALLPAILSIFVGALTEDDSFLYLNAVQGLSLLVDVFGRQVVGGLIKVYTGGGGVERRTTGPLRVTAIVKDVTATGAKGQSEVDKRLRVGEALVQVVQRAGDALATLRELSTPLSQFPALALSGFAPTWFRGPTG